MQLFNEPFLLQPEARDVITSNFTPNIFSYSLAFRSQQYNYAGAVSFLIALINRSFVLPVPLAEQPQKRKIAMTMAGYQTASFYRYRRLNTLLMSGVLVYSIFPIVYLLIASTKSARELYTTFGLSFGEFHLLAELARPGRIRRWHLFSMASQHAPLFNRVRVWRYLALRHGGLCLCQVQVSRP